MGWDALGRGVSAGVEAYLAGKRRQDEKEQFDKLHAIREAQLQLQKDEDERAQIEFEREEGRHAPATEATTAPFLFEDVEVPAFEGGVDWQTEQYGLRKEGREEDEAAYPDNDVGISKRKPDGTLKPLDLYEAEVWKRALELEAVGKSLTEYQKESLRIADEKLEIERSRQAKELEKEPFITEEGDINNEKYSGYVYDFLVIRGEKGKRAVDIFGDLACRTDPETVIKYYHDIYTSLSSEKGSEVAQGFKNWIEMYYPDAIDIQQSITRNESATYESFKHLKETFGKLEREKIVEEIQGYMDELEGTGFIGDARIKALETKIGNLKKKLDTPASEGGLFGEPKGTWSGTWSGTLGEEKQPPEETIVPEETVSKPVEGESLDEATTITSQKEREYLAYDYEFILEERLPSEGYEELKKEIQGYLNELENPTISGERWLELKMRFFEISKIVSKAK